MRSRSRKKSTAPATQPGFQLSTDGWAGYKNPVVHSLGAHDVSYAQLVKVYASSREGEQRYSPAECIDAVPVPVFGNPDPKKICTSHVERMNLSIRMSLRRFTRLTNAFSRKWSNLKAAIALFFAWYNYCKAFFNSNDTRDGKWLDRPFLESQGIALSVRHRQRELGNEGRVIPAFFFCPNAIAHFLDTTRES